MDIQSLKEISHQAAGSWQNKDFYCNKDVNRVTTDAFQGASTP